MFAAFCFSLPYYNQLGWKYLSNESNEVYPWKKVSQMIKSFDLTTKVTNNISLSVLHYQNFSNNIEETHLYMSNWKKASSYLILLACYKFYLMYHETNKALLYVTECFEVLIIAAVTFWNKNTIALKF